MALALVQCHNPVQTLYCEEEKITVQCATTLEIVDNMMNATKVTTGKVKIPVGIYAGTHLPLQIISDNVARLPDYVIDNTTKK